MEIAYRNDLSMFQKKITFFYINCIDSIFTSHQSELFAWMFAMW